MLVYGALFSFPGHNDAIVDQSIRSLRRRHGQTHTWCCGTRHWIDNVRSCGCIRRNMWVMLCKWDWTREDSRGEHEEERKKPGKTVFKEGY